MRNIISILFLLFSYFSIGQNIDTLIIECSSKYRNSLKSELIYLQKKWKDVPSPIILVYKGNDFRDYFHLKFKGEKRKTYDFGHGNNNFGDYQLYEEGGKYKNNPAYLNKKFKVYWQWKIASFPCCEGEYRMVKAYQPSIVKLELIE